MDVTFFFVDEWSYKITYHGNETSREILKSKKVKHINNWHWKLNKHLSLLKVRNVVHLIQFLFENNPGHRFNNIVKLIWQDENLLLVKMT